MAYRGFEFGPHAASPLQFSQEVLTFLYQRAESGASLGLSRPEPQLVDPFEPSPLRSGLGVDRAEEILKK